MSKINFSKEQLHIIKPNTTALKKTDVPPSLSNLSSPSGGKTPISLFSNKQEGLLNEIASPQGNRLSFQASTKFTSPLAPSDICDSDDKLMSCTVKSQRTKPINELITNEVKVQLSLELNRAKMEIFETIAKSLKNIERESERNEKIVKRNEESLKCFREEIEDFRATINCLSLGESKKPTLDEVRTEIQESHEELRALIANTTAQADEKITKEISALNKHVTCNLMAANSQEMKRMVSDLKAEIDVNLEKEINSLRRTMELCETNSGNEQELRSLVKEAKSSIQESFSLEMKLLNSQISLIQTNFEEISSLNQAFEEKIENKLADSTKAIAQIQEKNEKNGHAIEERYKNCLAISASIEDKLDRQVSAGLQKRIKELADSLEGLEKRLEDKLDRQVSAGLQKKVKELADSLEGLEKRLEDKLDRQVPSGLHKKIKELAESLEGLEKKLNGHTNLTSEGLKKKVNIDDLTKIQTVIDGGLRENFTKYDEKIIYIGSQLEALKAETEKIKKFEAETLPRFSEMLEVSRFQSMQSFREAKQSLDKKLDEQSHYLSEKQKGLDSLITNFINGSNLTKNDFMEKLLTSRQDANKQIEDLQRRLRTLEETITQVKLNDSGMREANTSSGNSSRISRHLNSSADGRRGTGEANSRVSQLKELKEALRQSDEKKAIMADIVVQGVPQIGNIKKIECKQMPPSQDVSMRSLKDELQTHSEHLKFNNPLLNKSDDNSMQVENFANNSCSSTEKSQSVASETTHALKYNEYLQKYEQFSRDIDSYLLSRKISPNNYLTKKGSSSKKGSEANDNYGLPEVKLSEFALPGTLGMGRSSFQEKYEAEARNAKFQQLSPWNLKEEHGKADVSVLSVDGGEDTSTNMIKQFASQNKLGINSKLLSVDKRSVHSNNSSILSQSHQVHVSSSNIASSTHKIFEIPQRTNPLKVSDLIKVSNTIGSGCEAGVRKPHDYCKPPESRTEPSKQDVPTVFKKKEEMFDQESEEVEYQLDEFGYILDENGNYILDDQGNYIQLSKEHIEYLKNNDALEEKFI